MRNALLILALSCPAARVAAAPADAVGDLRAWTEQWKRGTVDLLHPLPAPTRDAAGRLRWYRVEELESLRALLDRVVQQDGESAARLLLDLATTDAASDPAEERRRFASRQPWLVRRLAREALGRLKTDQAREWLRKVGLHDQRAGDGARRRAAAALALGLGGDDALADLSGAMTDPDALVRAAAAEALGRTRSPLGLTPLEQARHDPDQGVRLDALRSARVIEREHPEVRERVLGSAQAALADPAWPVRLLAARMLRDIPDRSSIPPLIDALEKESGDDAGGRRRVRAELRGTLMALTGVDFPAERTADWSAWWSDVAEHFELDPKGLHAIVPEQGARLFGIPIEADVVLFVLDVSGSMGQPGNRAPDGPSRLDVARTELMRGLRSLPRGTRFNIVAFNERIDAFADAPVELDPESLQRAGGYLDGLKPDGGTDLFGALEFGLGLIDPKRAAAVRGQELDTLVLLTDGLPSRGDVLLPEEIVAQVTRRNRREQVTIHAVETGAGESSFLRELSEQNGGAVARLLDE